MGWVMGFEPTNTGTTIRCLRPLGDTHHIQLTKRNSTPNTTLNRSSPVGAGAKMARQEGLEPPAYCLEGSCSIQLSYWRISVERVTGIGPAYPAWKAGVLPLNYTRKSMTVSAIGF